MRTGQGNTADGLGEQATGGVDVVIVDLQAEQSAELVEPQADGDPVGAGSDLDGLGLGVIVLVVS